MADDVVPVSFIPDRPGGGGSHSAPRRPASPMSTAAANHAPVFRELPRQNSQPSVNIELLHDVELTVKIELGRTKMRLDDVLRLGHGAVVSLDRLAGDPVDVFVNDRLVARGEVVVVDEKFAVRLTEVVSPIKDD
ncbi:MAG: flagellar motor switch protein FliN [Phycisphaerales bacterium]|jgi:flagellar motor switch protein FliN/FliY|nr:flagellar motor switch protein FliN [Phycisphaerales bacterium]